jgi:hypothetical protein
VQAVERLPSTNAARWRNPKRLRQSCQLPAAFSRIQSAARLPVVPPNELLTLPTVWVGWQFDELLFFLGSAREIVGLLYRPNELVDFSNAAPALGKAAEAYRSFWCRNGIVEISLGGR